MPAKKFSTELIVKECKQTYSGTTKNGQPYKLYQVIATKKDGTPIQWNLRSFSDLPRNVVIECECELYQSEQYGDSYTISPKDGQDRYSLLEKRVKELEGVVAEMRDFLQGRGEFRGSAANGSPAETPPPPPPPDPSPAAGPPTGSPPPTFDPITQRTTPAPSTQTDDIPF